MHLQDLPPLLALALVPLAVAPAAQAAPTQAPAYQVDFVAEGFPRAMNSSGEVVGNRSVLGLFRGWHSPSPGTSTLLPIPAGTSISYALDINEAGVIVGSVQVDILDEPGRACAWVPSGAGYQFVDLGALAPSVRSQATAINDAGDIVGYSVTPGFSGGPATLFSLGGPPVDLAAQGFAATPADVNDARQVVGGALRMDLDTGVVENLGTPPGNFTLGAGLALNELGQVAGYGISSVGGNNRQVTRYSDGTGWEVYGTLGVFNAAYGINATGDMACEIGIAGGTEPAVVLEGLGLFPLASLLAPGSSGWSLFGSFDGDIDDAGRIVVAGENFSSGESGAVLLTPLTCPDPVRYCVAFPNSVGSGALIDSSGSTSVAANAFVLEVQGAVPGQFGIFYYGPGQTIVPFGAGVRCVAAAGVGTFRLNPPQAVDAAGSAVRALDLTSPPSLPGTISAGSVWNFQFWYRDPAGGSGGFNLSDGLEVTFCD